MTSLFRCHVLACFSALPSELSDNQCACGENTDRYDSACVCVALFSRTIAIT